MFLETKKLMRNFGEFTIFRELFLKKKSLKNDFLFDNTFILASSFEVFCTGLVLMFWLPFRDGHSMRY